MKKIINSVSTRLKKLKKIQANYQKQKDPVKTVSTPKPKVIDKKEPLELKIAPDTVLKVLVTIALFLAALSLMYQLQSILTMTVIAFFLSMGLTPILNRLESWHVPRPFAIALLYLGFFGVMGLMVTTVIPIVIEQLLDLTRDFRNILTNNPVENNSWISLKLREANFDPAQFQTLLSEKHHQHGQPTARLCGLYHWDCPAMYLPVCSTLFSP